MTRRDEVLKEATAQFHAVQETVYRAWAEALDTYLVQKHGAGYDPKLVASVANFCRRYPEPMRPVSEKRGGTDGNDL